MTMSSSSSTHGGKWKPGCCCLRCQTYNNIHLQRNWGRSTPSHNRGRLHPCVVCLTTLTVKQTRQVCWLLTDWSSTSGTKENLLVEVEAECSESHLGEDVEDGVHLIITSWAHPDPSASDWSYNLILIRYLMSVQQVMTVIRVIFNISTEPTLVLWAGFYLPTNQPLFF